MELLVCLDVLLSDFEAIDRLSEENRVIVLQSSLDALYKVHHREHDKLRNAKRILSNLVRDYTEYERVCYEGFSVVNDTHMSGDEVDVHIDIAYRQGYVIVSNDVRVLSRAEESNVRHIRYKKAPSLMEKPVRVIDVDEDLITDIAPTGSLEIDDEISDVYENEFLELRCGEVEVLARYRKGTLQLIPNDVKLVGKIEPMDKYQQMAVDACLDGRVPLVILTGKAGVGKTLMAIASAFTKVKSKSTKRILISRPIVAMGNELGHLPGTLDEKMKHWVQPLHDNINLLQKNDEMAQAIASKGIVQVQSLEHIRGRSIRNAYVIIDEAQNLSPEEVKAVVTRIGQGGKLILCGDPYQTDKGGRESNGLAYVIERMKGHKLVAHVHLENSHRSEIAALAADRL